MDSTESKNKPEETGSCLEFVILWFFSIVFCVGSGVYGAYLGEMRPGGWNMQLLYPPLIGGGTGLVAYPIFRVLLQFGSVDKDKGLFSGMLAAVLLSAILCYCMVMSFR